jgi:hypothetical protein
MTDSIHLCFDIRNYNEAAINARLLHRNHGRIKSVGFFVIPLAFAVIIGIAAGRLFLNMRWDHAAMVAGYAALGYFFTALVMGLRNRAIIARLLQNSPLRAMPYSVTLSAQGVDRSGRLYPWAVFTGVATLPGLTVLQFSPLEGIPLPDKELPAGSTPDSLRTQIDQWRKATK